MNIFYEVNGSELTFLCSNMSNYDSISIGSGFHISIGSVVWIVSSSERVSYVTFPSGTSAQFRTVKFSNLCFTFLKVGAGLK